MDLPGPSFIYPSAESYGKDPIHEIESMVFKLNSYRKFEDIKFTYRDGSESSWMLESEEDKNEQIKLEVD